MYYTPGVIRTLSISLVLTFLLLFQQGLAQPWSNGMAATYVIGQPGFNVNGTAATASGLNGPAGVIVDPSSGKVFVSDQYNNRVLRYNNMAALTNGASAEAVFGQSTFTGSGSGVTSTTMYFPFALAISASGSLWVADSYNNRVLRFDNAATAASGSAANGVLGQSNLTSAGSGQTANSMHEPEGLAVKGTTLWVADNVNNRVLRFDNAAAKANGASADAVLGQPAFTSGASATTSTGLSNPEQLYVDGSGGLWVADHSNNRILLYKTAASKTNGGVADLVLGQASFTGNNTGTSNNTFNSPSSVFGDAAGNIYVLDDGNNRVLIFTNGSSLTNGAAASYVLGQSTFVTSGAGDAANQLSNPIGLFAGSSLVVADFGNNRVLNYIPMQPLPLQLLSFTARLQDNGQALLQWQTTDASTGGTFELEYSADSSTFHNILTTQAGQPGNQAYSYLQTTPAKGVNYYRLELIDPGGAITYSQVLSLTVRGAADKAAISLYPNPAQNSVVISLPSAAPAIIRILNSAGIRVKTITTNTPVNTVDISRLAPGFYVVQVLQKNLLSSCSFVVTKE